MPVFEICQWIASDGYLKDPSILKPAVDQILPVDGCRGVYSGVEEENTKSLWLLLPWDSYEHHKTYMKDPSYPSLLEKMQPSFATGPKDLAMNHVDFNKDPTTAIAAPCTEIVKLVLKEGKTKEDVENVVADLAARIDAENGTYAPVTWGQTVEDPDKFFMILGWDSSKAHRDVVGQESFKTSLQNLRSTVDLVIIHAPFKKH